MQGHARRGGDPWGDVAQDVQDVEPDAFDEGEPVPATTVTLVDGASFAVCGLSGDIDPGGVEGIFVGDTRICSRMALTIDDAIVEPLTLAVPGAGPGVDPARRLISPTRSNPPYRPDEPPALGMVAVGGAR